VAGKQVEVFTARPETLFGVSYVVVAPEHPLALDLATAERREAVASYSESASRKRPRTHWVADYVLGATARAL